MASQGETEPVVVTKEFLEKVLKSPIDKFDVSPGSVLGENYSCILYSVDVWKVGQESSSEPLHLLVKCFPTNPGRQMFLDQGGQFEVELLMYKEVIPELVKFQESAGAVKLIRPPFAPFHAGNFTPKDQRDGSNNLLENFIVMTDIRKSGGFRLRDRFKGFDLDHYRLVIEAQATLHALSWAYKCKTGVKFSGKYPMLNLKGFTEMIVNATLDDLKLQCKIAETLLKDDPVLMEGFEYFVSVLAPTLKLYYGTSLKEDEKHFTKDNILRKPGRVVENEEPWEVLLHGDAWSNNMMFRYDEATGRPVEVVLVDLQMSREGDPFVDMNYALYTSTTDDFREKHMTSMLYVYYDTFEDICRNFSVPTLPGWSWEEVNRRFHRAQMFGAYISLCGLPVVLKNVDEVKDLEKMKVTEADIKSEDFVNSDAMKEIMASFWSMDKPNPVLRERIRGVLKTTMMAGVL